MEEKVSSKALVLSFVGLVALTGLSWGLSYAHLGSWELVVAMLIAAGKTTLVLLFFMHLLESGAAPVFAILAGLFFVALLIGFVSGIDVHARAHPELIPPRVPSAEVGGTDR